MIKIIENDFLGANLNAASKSVLLDIKAKKFSQLLLLELKKILSWLSEHPEVVSLVVSSNTVQDCVVEDMPLSEIESLNKEIQKISLNFFHLPQTVVFDYGKEVSPWVFELSLAADIKLSHEHSCLYLDFLKRGLVPGAGGISLLEKMLSPAIVKNWLYRRDPIFAEELLRYGWISETYSERSREKVIAETLEHLLALPPIARIQLKQAFWEKWEKEWNSLMARDESICRVVLTTGDYKEANSEDPLFTNVRDFKRALNSDIGH